VQVALDAEVHSYFRQSARRSLLFGGWGLAGLEAYALLCALTGWRLTAAKEPPLTPMILPALLVCYLLARVSWGRTRRRALADPERYKRDARRRAATLALINPLDWRRRAWDEALRPTVDEAARWLCEILIVFALGAGFVELWLALGINPVGPVLLLMGAGFVMHGAVWFWCYDYER
jgi:hypothetical protein